MRKFFLLLAVLGMAAPCMFAGGSRNRSTSPDTTLRVAVIPVISSLPIHYIVEKGWDVENGFKIEKIVFSSGAPMGEALVSNLWDIGIMSAAGVFAAANYDAMCIADSSDTIGFRGLGLFVRPGSDILSVRGGNPSYPNVYGSAETVRGKTVLCPTGTVSQLHTLKWLEALGLESTDVRLVHMEFAQAYQAYLAGQGDIVALNPPFCFMAPNEGLIDIAPIDELGVKLNDMVFANKRSIDSKRELINKCLGLIYRAGMELEANQAAKEAALKDWYRVNGSDVDDATVAREAAKKLFSLDDIRAMNVKGGETLISTAEFFAGIGTVETSKLPVVRGNINGEFIRALLE